jgi:ABC-type proline/glycine betaine transport system ATPase subunit
VLAQYASPDEILAHPADDFVARFVGADRALKRLALWRVGDLELLDSSSLAPDSPTLTPETSLRDALSIILSEDGRPLAVAENGELLGYVSVELVTRALSGEGAAA